MFTQTIYPILIFTTNNYQAKWFKIDKNKKNKLQEIDRIFDEKEIYSDAEGMFKIRGRGVTVRSGSVEDWNEERRHEFKEHLKKCIIKTRELWNNGAYRKCIVVTPPIIKNQVIDALHYYIPHLTFDYISGNFLHNSLYPSLLSNIYKNLPPTKYSTQILIKV